MKETLWFRSNTSDIREDWVTDMSGSARWAWYCLLAYVKEAAVSQKASNRAASMSARTAARVWALAESEVQEMLTAAVASGRLVIDGETWIVTEIRHFVSEKTVQRQEKDLSDKSGQTETKAEKPAKRGRTRTPCHATVTVTGTVTSSDIGKPISGDSGNPTAASESAGETPYQQVERVLRIVGESIGGTEPVPDDVRRHLGERKPLRMLIGAIGVETTAALKIWAGIHKTAGLPWSTIWEERNTLLHQLSEGVRFAQRRDHPPGHRETAEDICARLMRERVDSVSFVDLPQEGVVAHR